MDSNVHYRQLNRNQKKNSPMSKFWIQKQNILSEGMPQIMNYDKRYVKHMVDVLNGEAYKDRHKKNLYNKFKKENENIASSRIEEHLSDKVKKILKKIDKNVDHIKKSIIDITKMNGLYLEEKAKKTFYKTHQLNNGSSSLDGKSNSVSDLNRRKSLKKFNLRKTQSDMNIKGNISVIDKLINSEKNGKKDDYKKNFIYVNDNYHRQLNFAFLKYNPEKHLKNIKFLVQVEPSIRDDVTNIIQEVQKDIEWKCDTKHFTKKYLNVKERFERIKNIRLLNEKEKEKENQIQKLKENLDDKKKLPNIRNNKNNKNSKIYKPRSIGSIYNKLNYGIKFNKKELNKLNAQKEQTKEEINHILIASKEIDNFIQDENIKNKIDMFKTDYAQKMYAFYQSNEANNSKNNLLEKDYFLEQKENIVNKIGNVFSFQIDKNANEQEKIFKGKIYDEAKKFRKRIVDGKRNALDEFNGYITTYQIKLHKEKNETNDDININQTALN